MSNNHRSPRRHTLPSTPVPVKCFCRDLERYKGQQTGTRPLLSVMGVILGFADSKGALQSDMSENNPKENDKLTPQPNQDDDMPMTTEQAILENCRLILDDGSGSVASLCVPHRFARQEDLCQSLRVGLIAECVVIVQDGGECWMDAITLWTDNAVADELLSLRGAEIMHKNRQSPQQQQQQQQQQPHAMTRSAGVRGYPSLVKDWTLGNELYEWIQSCASTGGVSLEDLSTVSGLRADALLQCLQTLQLEGQIYVDQNDCYQPL